MDWDSTGNIWYFVYDSDDPDQLYWMDTVLYGLPVWMADHNHSVCRCSVVLFVFRTLAEKLPVGRDGGSIFCDSYHQRDYEFCR